MNTKVILYVDMASQPARAILGFCRVNKINHEVKEVKIRKGEHMSDWYAKINPAKVIPAMQEVNE